MLMLAATSPASAQTCGTGGCAFWATEVNDSWFNPFRWGGILPWQGGVPTQDVTCRIELAVQVDVLGQGPAASCHHLQFNHTGVVVRVAGSSTRAEFNVHGTQMDNNGLILIGGQDALRDSSLIIWNNTNANGANGRIRLSAPPNHGAFLSSYSGLGWLLVNWPSHTIEGNGTIRVRLQNDGLVDANVPGRSLTFAGAHTIDNNNLVRARNGGSLVLSMPNGNFSFNQSGAGRIVVENGSGLALLGAGDLGLRGGRLRTLGTGLVTVFSQGFPIEDVQLEAGTRLTFSGNAGIYVGPLGLENDGLIHTGPNGWVTSRFGASTTMTGTGRLQLEGGALSALFGGGGQAMVNGPDHAIGGVGTIALALTNQGELLADRNGLSTGPNELRLQTSPMSNAGVMRAENGGHLRIFQITVSQSTFGRIEAGQNSAVELADARIVGGLLNTVDNGIIVATGSASSLEQATIQTGAQFLVPCSRALQLRGDVSNNGILTLDSSGCGPANAQLIGDGVATLQGTGVLLLSAHGAGANVLVDGGNQSLRLGTFLRVLGSGRVARRVFVDGSIEPDQTYMPVGPIGTLTLNAGARMSLGAQARLIVEMRSATDHDRIGGMGQIDLAGSLELRFLDGYKPTPGTTADVVIGPQPAGGFTRIAIPAGVKNLDARVEVLADRARVHFTPAIFSADFEPKG